MFTYKLGPASEIASLYLDKNIPKNTTYSEKV